MDLAPENAESPIDRPLLAVSEGGNLTFMDTLLAVVICAIVLALGMAAMFWTSLRARCCRTRTRGQPVAADEEDAGEVPLSPAQITALKELNVIPPNVVLRSSLGEEKEEGAPLIEGLRKDGKNMCEVCTLPLDPAQGLCSKNCGTAEPKAGLGSPTVTPTCSNLSSALKPKQQQTAEQPQADDVPFIRVASMLSDNSDARSSSSGRVCPAVVGDGDGAKILQEVTAELQATPDGVPPLSPACRPPLPPAAPLSEVEIRLPPPVPTSSELPASPAPAATPASPSKSFLELPEWKMGQRQLPPQQLVVRAKVLQPAPLPPAPKGIAYVEKGHEHPVCSLCRSTKKKRRKLPLAVAVCAVCRLHVCLDCMTDVCSGKVNGRKIGCRHVFDIFAPRCAACRAAPAFHRCLDCLEEIGTSSQSLCSSASFASSSSGSSSSATQLSTLELNHCAFCPACLRFRHRHRRACKLLALPATLPLLRLTHLGSELEDDGVPVVLDPAIATRLTANKKRPGSYEEEEEGEGEGSLTPRSLELAKRKTLQDIITAPHKALNTRVSSSPSLLRPLFPPHVLEGPALQTPLLASSYPSSGRRIIDDADL